jgi:hypothetical protein
MECKLNYEHWKIFLNRNLREVHIMYFSTIVLDLFNVELEGYMSID